MFKKNFQPQMSLPIAVSTECPQATPAEEPLDVPSPDVQRIMNK